MSLQERLQGIKRREKIEADRSIADAANKKTLRGQAEREKKEEIDRLGSTASQKLLPFVQIVNNELFKGEGKVGVSKFGPFLNENGEEYSEPYVVVYLAKHIRTASSPGYHDSSSGFALALSLNREGTVEISGGARIITEAPLYDSGTTVGKEEEVFVSGKTIARADLGSSEATQQIENGIVAAIENGDCYWSEGLRPDLSP